MAKRIRITVDGVAYHAILQDNPLVEKIIAMCPFVMEYNRTI